MKVQLISKAVVCRFVALTKVAAQILLAVVALGSMAEQSQAALIPTIIFSEDFSATPTPGKFNFSGGGTQTVTGGRLEMYKPIGITPLYTSTEDFLDTTFTVEALIGAYNPPGHVSGNESLGLVIGNRTFNSFFGFEWLVSGPGDSIFYEGTTAGGNISGYLGMPWIAAADGVAMHKIKVDVNAVTKTFNVTFTDAYNPLNVYTNTFTDLGWSPVGGVGLFANFGGAGVGTYGYLDNLTVTALREAPAPEPSSVVLLGLGSLVLMARRRSRR